MIGYGEARLSEITQALQDMDPGYHRAAGRNILRKLTRKQHRSAVQYRALLDEAHRHARMGSLVETATAAFDARASMPYKRGKAPRRAKK